MIASREMGATKEHWTVIPSTPTEVSDIGDILSAKYKPVEETQIHLFVAIAVKLVLPRKIQGIEEKVNTITVPVKKEWWEVMERRHTNALLLNLVMGVAGAVDLILSNLFHTPTLGWFNDTLLIFGAVILTMTVIMMLVESTAQNNG